MISEVYSFHANCIGSVLGKACQCIVSRLRSGEYRLIVIINAVFSHTTFILRGLPCECYRIECITECLQALRRGRELHITACLKCIVHTQVVRRRIGGPSGIVDGPDLIFISTSSIQVDVVE